MCNMRQSPSPRTPPRILGVHSGPDASACLLVGDTVVSAMAQERLSRVKHDGGEPIACIDLMLAHAGLQPADIDLVVRCSGHGGVDLGAEAAFYGAFPRVEVTAQHQLLHAWAASVMAPDRPALVWVIDGQGCRAADADVFEVESVYRHERGQLTPLETLYRPRRLDRPAGPHTDSLGSAYAAVGRIVFGSGNAAGKLMALAAFSQHTHAVPEPFLFGPGQPFALNPDWLAFLNRCPPQVHWQTPLAADLAHAIQQGLERYGAWRTQALSAQHGCHDWLLGGGVALNCKHNGLLANAPGVRSVDVFPAASDDGLAVGAAVWALRERFGVRSPIRYTVGTGVPHVAPVNASDEVVMQIAQRLVQGQAIGIWQGGSEFGPRALGQRSILSAAHAVSLKTRLNEQIKRREAFRPFGGIVLRRHLHTLTSDALAGPHMLSAARIKPEAVQAYPALAHVDHTIRLQVVDEDGGLLHRVLRAYEGLSGRVALINTSFNGPDEPIVETLAQARACAQRIGLDGLYANGVLT
jgi:carbamoyltransferase